MNVQHNYCVALSKSLYIHASTIGFCLGDILHIGNYLLGKGGYVFGSVGLSVCLSVSNSYERTEMKLYGGVLGSTMKN